MAAMQAELEAAQTGKARAEAALAKRARGPDALTTERFYDAFSHFG